MEALAARCLARAAGFALVMVLGAAHAHAAPGSPADATFRFDWPSVPGCPSSSVVLAHAKRAVAGAAEVDHVLAKVELSAPAAGGEPWRLHIRTRTVRGGGERSLEAGSCAELARAAGLLMALAALRMSTPVEDERDEILPFAEWTPEPGAFGFASPAQLPRRRRQGAPTTASEDGTARFAVGLGGWLDIGLLPRAAFGPSARFEVARGPWAARLGIVAALPQDTTLAEAGVLGATFDALGANLELCRALPWPSLTAVRSRGCAGLEVDRVRARGAGDESFETARTSMLAFAGASAEWTLAPRWRLGIDARFGPSLMRPTFVVQAASGATRTLHQPAAVRAGALLTLSFVF